MLCLILFSSALLARYCSIVVTSRNLRTSRPSVHCQFPSPSVEKKVNIHASTSNNNPTLRADRLDKPNCEMRSLLEIWRSFLSGEEYLFTQKHKACIKSARSSTAPRQR